MSANYLTIDGFKIAVWTSAFADPPCVATNMTVAVRMLEGYGLTEEEKNDIRELQAGYCRLIDERGLNGFGETEFEAIQDLFSKATKVDKKPKADNTQYQSGQ